MNYLIYHPEREVISIGDTKVYHDSFDGNQDPYIWNEQFLHSFCHLTQISVEIGDTIFWVSSKKSTMLDNLWCDCVFVIEEKTYWGTANHIESSDEIVDSKNAFEHHYKWVNEPYNQHNFKKRKRYTLKADKDKSFQPQNEFNGLIDGLPILIKMGISKEILVQKISMNQSGKRSRNTRPFPIDNETAKELINEISKKSPIKLTGKFLMNKYPLNLTNNK